ncbi:hypothetical protein SBRY_140028 [Actinacidiphila bryophytorum]|uniref:Uncharacterized protein n=1 Tax=Actinacidiphila bryophytorum TaxID=1436133 RepID=A0A9W4EDD8_9ACTN|nr:hypothetical protein SBRY_140028 [Actinacidiphila bryophytorum]
MGAPCCDVAFFPPSWLVAQFPAPLRVALSEEGERFQGRGKLRAQPEEREGSTATASGTHRGARGTARATHHPGESRPPTARGRA